MFICIRPRSAAAMLLAAMMPAAAATAPTAEPTGVPCSKVSLSGGNIVPGSTLSVTVNGVVVGQYDQNPGGEIGPFMKPGLNRVGLSFAAPGKMGPMGTQAGLRCLPPNVRASRTGILQLQPTAKRLSAEVTVNYVPQ